MLRRSECVTYLTLDLFHTACPVLHPPTPPSTAEAHFSALLSFPTVTERHDKVVD